MGKEKLESTLPYILEAKTFYWTPGSSASSRRANEKKRMKEVYEFFEKKGFEVSEENGNVTAEGKGITVMFSYKESCQNVYKNILIARNGKKSNITALKNL